MPRPSLADTLRRVFESPNVPDTNLEPANIVDGLAMLAQAINRLARAVQNVTEENKTTEANHG